MIPKSSVGLIKFLLSRCRKVQGGEDYIESLLSTSPRNINEKLAEWVDSARKNSNVYPRLAKDGWYVCAGKTKEGDVLLVSGKDLLEFRVRFVPPARPPEKFSTEMWREYELHYFSSYQTAWQVVVNFNTTLNQMYFLKDAPEYLLHNAEDCVCSRMEKIRLRYRASGDQELKDKLQANIRFLAQPLQAIKDEVKCRNV